MIKFENSQVVIPAISTSADQTVSDNLLSILEPLGISISTNAM